MTNAATSAIEWEFVAISATATGARLRVGEALTMRPDAQLPSRLQFYGKNPIAGGRRPHWGHGGTLARRARAGHLFGPVPHR